MHGEVVMNIQPNLRMDKAAFLAWQQTKEGRYELAGGCVVMMTGASRVHARIVRNLDNVLSGRLDRRSWEVFREFGLDAGPETLRYPDIVVDRAGGGNKEYTANQPVLLAEVLSPSTAAIDLGEKASEYMRIPSVLAYLVLSQDEPKAWIWIRQEDGRAAEPEIVSKPEASIRVDALHLEFPLSAAYTGIEFG
jgi:Uma2 family endonuclease